MCSKIAGASRLLVVTALGVLLVGAPLAVAQSVATVQTDKADYAPGETAQITGAGFAPGEEVTLQVIHTNGTDEGGAGHSPWGVTADSAGGFSTWWYVDPDDSAGGSFLLTAVGGTSGLTAQTTFTDANPSANLDQCGNDPAPSPHTDGCSASASDWVNGNLGASKSVYFEGDSIPYRMKFDSLSLGTHAVTIKWDTTKSGKHALDYLTSFDRTVATANPCLGVSGCSSFTTFPIPKDPQVDNEGAPITQLGGSFTLYGGTITTVSGYSYDDGSGFAGDKSARITVTFTTSVANPVLAWGGHISSRADWGANNSAVAISGSPYHTRLIALDGSGGNQDRSLSADAVIFPGSITVVKDATPNGPASFSFTASPLPLSNFSLVDDGTSASTKLFANIINFQTYSLAETVPSDWSLTGITCSISSPNGGSQTVSSPSVNPTCQHP